MTAVLPVSDWRVNPQALGQPYRQYVSPDGSTFIPAGQDFVSGAMSWGVKSERAAARLRAGAAAPGKPVYITSEAEITTWQATVGPDGGLTDFKLFANQGGESVAVDAKGNVYIAAGQIYVYDPSGQPDRHHRRAGAAAATRVRRQGPQDPVHPRAHFALRGAHPLRRTVGLEEITVNTRRVICFAIVGLAFTSFSPGGQKAGGAEVWLTTPDKSALFERQKSPLALAAPGNGNPTIDVDEQQKFQTIDGFGYALTGGSAQHLVRMGAGAQRGHPERAVRHRRRGHRRQLPAADHRRVGSEPARLHLRRHARRSDGPGVTHFDLGPDRADVIPVMKEILKLNPRIKILASPWTAPSWMKTNNNAKGGALKPEAYDAYARYFVKYMRAMKAEGIRDRRHHRAE